MTKSILRFFLILIFPVFVTTGSDATCLSAEERFERVREHLSDNRNFTSHTQSKRIVEDFYEPDLEYVREEYSHAKNREELLEALHALDVKVKKYMWENHPGTLSFTELNTIVYTWVSVLSSHVVSQDAEILSTDEDTHPSLKEVILEGWTCRVSDAYSRSRWMGSYVEYADTPSISIPFVGKTGIIDIRLFNRGWGFYLRDRRTSAVIWLGCPSDPKVDFDYLRKERADKGWYHDYEHAQRSGLFDRNFFQENSAYFARLNQHIVETEDPHEQALLELTMFITTHERQKRVTPENIFSLCKGEHNSIAEILQKGVEVLDDGFYSLNQYESYVEMARSLGLRIHDDKRVDHETEVLRQQTLFYQYSLNGLQRFMKLVKRTFLEEYGEELYKRVFP